MANYKLNEGFINIVEHAEIWETASILEDIDLMFDLTNGTARKFWFEYSTGKKVNTPTPDALAVTLRSMQGLWEDLQSEGFNELNLRYLNQDGIENFFGLMRQECGDCHHPTCLHLEAAFKTALVTRFSGTYRPELESLDEKLETENFVALNDCLATDIIGQRLLKKLKIENCLVCKLSLTDNAEQSGLSKAFKNYVFKEIDTYSRNVLSKLHNEDVVSLSERRLLNECNLNWFSYPNHNGTVTKKLINALSRILITESYKALNSRQAIIEVPSANAIKLAQQMGKAK
ncbi:hypothetical protein KQX54_010901 [Cotesia glomerata]|uniref:Transposable element P transposase-like RNase H C-terminal domain-containing protein n=1 Tax=Cotesia glomerata TaxID=32391 RepID=A0AAV7IBC7_COTGL|nr:hypothetical protein KQX54_010901 [Cotesia glomerata]